MCTLYRLELTAIICREAKKCKTVKALKGTKEDMNTNFELFGIG
jgi:hypothetical protein